MDDSLEKVLKIIDLLYSLEPDRLNRLPTPVLDEFWFLLNHWHHTLRFAGATDVDLKERLAVIRARLLKLAPRRYEVQNHRPRPFVKHGPCFMGTLESQRKAFASYLAEQERKQRHSKEDG